MDEQMREKFEKKARDMGYDIQVYGDGNYADETDDLWEVWQEAHAAALSQPAAAELAGVTDAEVERFQKIKQLAGTEDALDDLLQSRSQGVLVAVLAERQRCAGICIARANTPFPQTKSGRGYTFSREWDIARNSDRDCAAAILYAPKATP